MNKKKVILISLGVLVAVVILVFIIKKKKETSTSQENNTGSKPGTTTPGTSTPGTSTPGTIPTEVTDQIPGVTPGNNTNTFDPKVTADYLHKLFTEKMDQPILHPTEYSNAFEELLKIFAALTGEQIQAVYDAFGKRDNGSGVFWKNRDLFGFIAEYVKPRLMDSITAVLRTKQIAL